MKDENLENKDQESENENDILGVEITDEDIEEYDIDEKIKKAKLGDTSAPKKRGPKKKPSNSIKDNMRKHFSTYSHDGLVEKIFEIYDKLRDAKLRGSSYKRQLEREKRKPIQEFKKFNDRTMRLMKKRIYEWKDSDLPYNNFKYLKQKLNVKMDNTKNVSDFIRLVELFLKIRKHIYEMATADKMAKLFIREHNTKIEKMKTDILQKKKGKPAQISDEEPASSMTISPEMQELLNDDEDANSVSMDNDENVIGKYTGFRLRREENVDEKE